MMKNIGVDIAEVDRIRTVIEKYGARFLNRVFTKSEIEYCQSKNKKFRFTSFAARFAVKEAFYKAAFPVVRHPISWHECQVINDSDNVPRLFISEKLKKELNGQCLISLSHSDKYAVAVVAIE